MRIRVSLPDADVSFIDSYARDHGLQSRSAALHEAVEALRNHDLGAQYDDAAREWSGSGEPAVWESTVGDGLDKTDGAAHLSL